MPLLRAAQESLKSLNKNDISEVRSMKRPPEGVVYVIEAICIVKGLGTSTKGKVDYWELGRNMLSNAGGFLDSLVHYDKESLTEVTINKLKPYVDNPAFQPKKIIKVNCIFCLLIFLWLRKNVTNRNFDFFRFQKLVLLCACGFMLSISTTSYLRLWNQNGLL